MRKIGFLLFPLLLLSTDISFALTEDNQKTGTKQFVNNLKDYFHSYYGQALEKDIITSKQDVLKDVNGIFRDSRVFADGRRAIEENENIETLVDSINDYLEDEGKSINLFIINGSDIVNCWLGDLIEEETMTRRIWDGEIKCKVKIIGNLIIGDFIDFSTKGKDTIDVGVRRDVIYYNLDAYKRRAGEVWNFLLGKSIRKERRYTSSRSNRLRKRLYVKSWGSLFLEYLDKNKDLERAKHDFIDEAVRQLKENSLYHEAGHIYARKFLSATDEVEEEIVAFLTELKYGELPYESLDGLISSRWHNSLQIHKMASDKILSSILYYIQFQKKKGNKDYRKITIQNIKSKKSIDSLYKLTPDLLRVISEYIYDIYFERY